MAPNVTTLTLLGMTETDSRPGLRTLEKRSPPEAEPEKLPPPEPEPEELELDPAPSYEWRIVWRNVIAFVYLHTASLYGIYLAITTAKLLTVFWVYFLGGLGGMGVTAGAHRLWAHRSYKAKWPLRLLLVICNTIAFQNHIYEWVRDHRVHHKFTDTDADPHNSSRGFFFSHIGWLMVRKHPDVSEKGKKVDMSDLERDPLVMWQKRWYLFIMPLFCFVLPAWIPVRVWGEDPWVSWHVAAIFRYTLSLNCTWLVNSAAHIWGVKPYDRNMSPVESVPVAVAAFGEGWHNYHHVFPWDYKAAELGNYRLNFTTAFIDFFAWLGWAYDLKTVPERMALSRAARCGDGSHPRLRRRKSHGGRPAVWGWGDPDMPAEEVRGADVARQAL
ncbi:acyl-CoA Delta-9 desaturase-like [Schistocerca gregaria]|uniref:acyl-CoA Delta-9 desaturase-like n=1 Tax=Schistocerca gregaria TaxID=7010 RepID=UPI00211DAB63|nr:acyl-CoA Delta-9 desaturase-like [Schistocerca gregaria]XP_049853599.1 acyl-CoA Delta-9 desaturase-like [Schistocerca gregaria]XP_049853600.1 acyl-CoA Delta-9 desaturase-like [Schistocerca gregaria]